MTRLATILLERSLSIARKSFDSGGGKARAQNEIWQLRQPYQSVPPSSLLAQSWSLACCRASVSVAAITGKWEEPLLRSVSRGTSWGLWQRGRLRQVQLSAL